MKFIKLSIVGFVSIIAFTSCKKNNYTSILIINPTINPLTEKLEICLKLNNSYADSTGKIADGVTSGTPSFVNDRKGNINSALYLNGSSKVTFTNVNFKGQEVTVSLWTKAYYNSLDQVLTAMSPSGGIIISLGTNNIAASVSIPSTNGAISSNIDNNWHHIAVTYNGTDILLYIDGTLEATTNHPGSISDGPRDVVLGFFNNGYWRGIIDEVRIYSKVLTASDIQQLAAL